MNMPDFLSQEHGDEEKQENNGSSEEIKYVIPSELSEKPKAKKPLLHESHPKPAQKRPELPKKSGPITIVSLKDAKAKDTQRSWWQRLLPSEVKAQKLQGNVQKDIAEQASDLSQNGKTTFIASASEASILQERGKESQKKTSDTETSTEKPTLPKKAVEVGKESKREKPVMRFHEPEGAFISTASRLGVNLAAEEGDTAHVKSSEESKVFWISSLAVSLFIVVIAYLGMSWFGTMIARDITRLNMDSDRLSSELSLAEERVRSYLDMEKQFLGVSNLFSRRVSWSRVLSFIEDNSVIDVSYTDLEADEKQEVTLSGAAPSYTAMAQQIKAFQKKTEAVTSVDVSGAKRKEKKRKGSEASEESSEVTFVLRMLLQKEAFIDE